MQLKRIGRQVHQDQRGQVAAGFVVLLLIFLGLMAFTVDLGFWLLDRRGGQNQVDASVLAGVQTLPAPATDLVPAANDAQDWLERNSRTDQGQVISECGLDEDDGYDVLESPSSVPESIFAFADKESRDNTDGVTHYDTIRACIRRNGLVIFARVLDVAGVQVPAVAAAAVQMEPVRYALMAMHESTNCNNNDGQRTLYLHGGAIIELGEGGSYTASACANQGLSIEGSSGLSGGYHDVCGNWYQGGSSLSPPEVTPHVCGFPDPWVAAQQPIPGSPVNGNCGNNNLNGGTHTLQPGTHTSNVRVNGATLILAPGIHIFRCNLEIGSGSLTGNDVLLFFTCRTGVQCNGAVGARFTASGGDITLNALDCGLQDLPPCPHPAQQHHIVIWVDRTATQQNQSQALVDLGGGGRMTIGGHIYNWNGSIMFRGNAGANNRHINGTVLGNRVDFAGATTYNVNWDEEFAPRLPAISLVE